MRSFCQLSLLAIILVPVRPNLEEGCLAQGTCESDLLQAADEYAVYEEDEGEEPPCVDEESECEYWAGLDPSECDENPEYMHEACRRACKLCVPPVDIGVEQDTDAEQEEAIEALINKTYEYMENVVMVEPKYEKVRYHCKNKDSECSYWAVLGECESSKDYMQMNCAPACQMCDLLTYEGRCPLDPDAENAWEVGDLDKMFEKITTEEEYRQYEPIVLSRPDYVNGDTEETADYIIGPWVVLLENFSTPEECKRLIELGHELGYERSSDVGELKFDGTFEDDINEGRTSTNAWCEGVCSEDPLARNVTRRIEKVTGIPEANSEHLQLLRYLPGQKYQPHHDFIDFEKDQQSGVRLMTLYLYLNEVEEGGGTNFPQLDLTVQPKQGRALLWPSVLNDAPEDEDGRTEHQALPVKKGVKFGANGWLHQRDFKTPNEMGC